MTSARHIAEIVGMGGIDFDTEARRVRAQQWGEFIDGIEGLKEDLKLNSKPFLTIQMEEEGLSQLLDQAKFDFSPREGLNVRCLDVVCSGYMLAKEDTEHERRVVQFVSPPRNTPGSGRMTLKFADCKLTTMQFAEFQGSPEERFGIKIGKVYDPDPPAHIVSDVKEGTIYVPISHLRRP